MRQFRKKGLVRGDRLQCVKPPEGCAHLAKAMLAALCLIYPLSVSASEAPSPIKIAILDFSFEDTSGETRDQTAEHQAKMEAFMKSLRSDLASGGSFEPVSISCGGAPCSVARSEPSESLEAAKRAGARLVLYGAFHKVSTLVSWAKYDVFDVDQNRLIADKLLTYRDDNEEAWRRFETFLWREIKDQDIPGLLANPEKN